MAEEDAAGTGGEAAGEATAGGGGKSKLIIIAGAVFLVALGGGGAYFLGASGGGDEAEAARHEAEAATDSGGASTEGHGGAGGLSSRVNLDPFVVNLADDGAQRYLKVHMVVEFFGDQPPPAFAIRRPEVRDLVLTLLSSKYVADVRTIEGKQQLRDEVVARINRVLDDDAVKAIYFSEFIVQ